MIAAFVVKIKPHHIAPESFARMPAYLALSSELRMESSLYSVTAATRLYNPFPKGALPTRSNKACKHWLVTTDIMMHNKACKHWPVTTAVGDIQQQDQKPEHDTPVRKAPGLVPVTSWSSHVFLGPLGSFQV